MGSIGIRTKPEEVIFSIYEDDEFYLDSIRLPKFLTDEEKLAYLRNILKDLFNEFNISSAAFKVMEGNIRSIKSSTFRRIENESIIKEVIYSSGITNYEMLKNANFSKLLSIHKSIVTDLIKGKYNKKNKAELNENDFKLELKEFEKKIPELNGVKNEEQREAIVSAFIAKEIEKSQNIEVNNKERIINEKN